MLSFIASSSSGDVQWWTYASPQVPHRSYAIRIQSLYSVHKAFVYSTVVRDGQMFYDTVKSSVLEEQTRVDSLVAFKA